MTLKGDITGKYRTPPDAMGNEIGIVFANHFC